MHPSVDPTLKNGSRGKRVLALQDVLNYTKPSSLPLLNVDGVFGAKTEARVKEFQRNVGLRQTGIVDTATLAKITPLGNQIDEIGTAFRQVLVQYYMPGCIGVYDREWRQSYDRLVPVGAAVIPIVGVVVVVFFAFCATVIAINTNAQNQPKSARLGRAVNEELSRIREAMAENRPSDLAVRAYDGIRRMAREFAAEMGERKRRCEEQTPVAQQTVACRAALAAFMTVLTSLNEKLARLPGGALSINLPSDVLVAAVLASIRAIVLALNAIAQECACPFIAF